MKTRRCRRDYQDCPDPAPFDYTLMSHLYVHNDGSDVIDFGGFATHMESRRQVETFLGNKSFAALPGGSRPDARRTRRGQNAVSNTSVAGNTYIHLQVDEDDGHQQRPQQPVAPLKHTSQLANVGDASERIWLFLQVDEDTAPFARHFANSAALFDYLARRNLKLPSAKSWGGRTGRCGARRGSELPLTRWIDIQTGALDSDAAQTRLRELLSKFPLHSSTIEDCLFMSAVDRVETEFLSLDKENEGYLFFTLACTPLDAEAEDAGADGGGNAILTDPFGNDATGASPVDDNAPLFNNNSKKALRRGATLNENKTVMSLRFEAVGKGMPRSSVPEPVPVAVIAFTEYIITIHEQPFAELDDVLRMIQLYCFRKETDNNTLSIHGNIDKQRFTTSFVFTTLFQVAVGHHIDSVTLARSVDELGDVVFEVKKNKKDRDKVVRRITDLRRCFGECGADVTRRANIIAALLQPGYLSFQLLQPPFIRGQLENTLSHLRYVQQELSECRDTVAVSNWYHNVTLQWDLLRKGNKALRSVLLLTEVTNIIYPVLIFQTLYAMNVRVPFDSEGDPPSESYIPFIVFAIAIVVYMLGCGRAILRVFRRKSFETQLLA